MRIASLKFWAVLVLLMCGVAGAKNVFVAVDGNDLFDGSSETAAKQTIQRAVYDANSGDVIILLPGIYSGDGNRDINLPGKDLTIQSSEPNDPVLIARTLIECGGGAVEHFAIRKTVSDINTIEIRGLSFTGGKSDRILDFYNAEVRITNCRFFENTSQSVILANKCTMTMQGCEIQNCYAKLAPGIALLAAADSNVVVGDSKILGHNDGGIMIGVSAVFGTMQGNWKLRNCVITSGGGPRYKSVDLWDMGLRGSTATVTNCTLPGGITSKYCNLNVQNSILWPSVMTITGGSSEIQYSNTSYTSGGGTNIWADPKYATGSNYLLSVGSPCIDKGIETDIHADIDGLYRPVDGNSSGSAEYDMGAAEYDPAAKIMYAEQDIIFGRSYTGAAEEEVGKITLRSLGGGDYGFKVLTGNSWLKAEPGNGILHNNAEIKLFADASELALGKYYSYVVIEREDVNNVKTVIPVILAVGQARIVPDQFATIQSAIDGAANDDIVIIRPGTYSGRGNYSISLRGKRITVRSERPGDADVVARTILSGPWSSGFYLSNYEKNDSVIEGLTITNFDTAICCTDSSPTIRDCVITGSTSCQGAMRCESNSSTVIERCRFENNDVVLDTQMSTMSTIAMKNCLINENSSMNTDLLFLNGGYMEGCVFINNYTAGSLLAYSPYRTPQAAFAIRNCTFFKNSTIGSVIKADGLMDITNCIMWDEAATELPITSFIKAKNCCIKGGYAGENNISSWPRFAFVNDCRLMAGSPCIDAGVDLGILSDAAGRDRAIDGDGDGAGSVDIGAYEYANQNAPAVSLIDGAYFETYENGFEPRPLKMLVRNLGRKQAKFIITSDSAWLSAEPNIIDIDKEVKAVRMRVDPAGLAIGNYEGMLTVSDVNGGGKIEVKAQLRVARANCVPGQYATINAALAASQNGDYIVLEPGRYTGADNCNLQVSGKIVTICSENPFDSDESSRAVLDFAGSTANRIYMYDTSLQLLGLCVENCTNSDGTVKAEASNLTADNCVFRNNIYDDSGDNAVLQGFFNGRLNLNHCRFEDNVGSNVVWTDNYFSGEIKNCVFRENGTLAVLTLPGATGIKWVLEHNIIAGNYGPALRSNASEIQMRYCTITGNSSGGVSLGEAAGHVENCIIWGNGNYNLQTSGVAKVRFCDVGGGASGIGNFDADPCFVSAADGDYRLKTEGWRWDDQGKIWTWDSVTSRCVDAGNPGAMMEDEPVLCIADPYGRIGKNLRVDIGAYGGTAEGSMPYTGDVLLSDISNDLLVNCVDYAAVVGGQEDEILNIPGDVNRDSYIDWEDVAVICGEWLNKSIRD